MQKALEWGRQPGGGIGGRGGVRAVSRCSGGAALQSRSAVLGPVVHRQVLRWCNQEKTGRGGLHLWKRLGQSLYPAGPAASWECLVWGEDSLLFLSGEAVILL